MRDGRAEPGGRKASFNRMSTDRAASPTAWPCRTAARLVAAAYLRLE